MKRLSEIDIPIYSGVYFNQRAIRNRASLNVEIEQYQINSYKSGASSKTQTLPLHKQQGIVYGYAEEYRGVFTGVGHIKQNDNGSYYPMVRYKEDYKVRSKKIKDCSDKELRIINTHFSKNYVFSPIKKVRSEILNKVFIIWKDNISPQVY